VAEPITKVQRWLDLIAFLVSRRLPVAVDDLMERLPAYARDWAEGTATARASVRRKFERDKDELRALGIPLETVRYRLTAGGDEVEGYRIQRRDFYLPYLKLLEKGKKEGSAAVAARPGASTPTIEVPRYEAAAAIRGLHTLADLPAFPLAGAARSALRKITFDLDPEGFGETRILFAVPPDTARATERTRLLADALQRRKRVTFTYHGMQRGLALVRTARPWGLLFQHSHWYLVGWDETRQAERIFRVDRMDDVEVSAASPATPDYDIPDTDVLARYRNREAWELGEAEDAVTVRVRMRFPISLWAERNGLGALVRDEGEAGAVREFEVRQSHAFLRWILSLAGEAEILSPPALKGSLTAMAQQVAALYGEGGEP
jgi:proteasome accessory factor B